MLGVDGEMQDAEFLMRQKRLDEALSLGVPARHGVMHRPVAPGWQEMRLHTAAIDDEVEGGLLGEKVLGVGEAFLDRLRPDLP